MLFSPTHRLETAYRALKEYEIQPVLIAFLQHSENVTFRVEAPGETFLLRLHSPRTKAFGQENSDSRVIESELLWLEALRREDLPVPPPISNKAGKYVSQAGGINLTLLGWQEGELMTRDAESPETAAQIGTLVGRLHAHASQWTPPAGFLRPLRDASYFQSALAALLPAVQDGRVTPADYQTLQTSLELLNEETQRLPRSSTTWGLLHGDLHRGNFLLNKEQIRLIDFSMCAFGHFLYDLATCLSNIRLPFHTDFLQNYTQFMPLPGGYERLLEGYFVASYIATFALWVEDAQSQETFVQRVSYIAREYAARFNRDERFWFT